MFFRYLWRLNMRRLHCLLLLVLCVLFVARAAGDEKLTFVMVDGETVDFSTNGLIITYNDYAHALVSNDETSAVIDLARTDYMCFTHSAPGDDVKADVNADGEVNIADVNSVISVIMENTSDAGRADVNDDGEVNIADINAVIAAIFGN